MLGITHNVALTLEELQCINQTMQAFSIPDCDDCNKARAKIAKAIKEATGEKPDE